MGMADNSINRGGTPGASKTTGPGHVTPVVNEVYQTGTNTVKRHTTSGKKPGNRETPHASHPDMK